MPTKLLLTTAAALAVLGTTDAIAQVNQHRQGGPAGAVSRPVAPVAPRAVQVAPRIQAAPRVAPVAPRAVQVAPRIQPHIQSPPRVVAPRVVAPSHGIVERRTTGQGDTIRRTEELRRERPTTTTGATTTQGAGTANIRGERGTVHRETTGVSPVGNAGNRTVR